MPRKIFPLFPSAAPLPYIYSFPVHPPAPVPSLHLPIHALVSYSLPLLSYDLLQITDGKIPLADVFQDNLYTKEEMKVTWECQKIMNIPDLPVSCTSVRIPTFRWAAPHLRQ